MGRHCQCLVAKEKQNSKENKQEGKKEGLMESKERKERKEKKGRNQERKKNVLVVQMRQQATALWQP